MPNISKLHAGHEHPEIVELLPWYANGTLSTDERARVKRHVDACPSCRAELQADMRLRELMGDEPEQSDEVTVFARVRNAGGHWGGIAAALAIVSAGVLSSAIWLNQPSDESLFRTLSNDVPLASTVHFVDLEFRSDASANDIRATLGRVHGQIVSGPDKNGTYRVAIPSRDSSIGIESLLARETSIANVDPVP